jgi:hypothetical protein
MYERVLEAIKKADTEQSGELTQRLNTQNIPFTPMPPNCSLVFQRSRLWRRDRFKQHEHDLKMWPIMIPKLGRIAP